MAFNHQDYIDQFLANPGQFPDPKYGVRLLQPADLVPGETYWQVVGIHHLTPAENRGNRNVFIEALDEAGNRITNPPIWAGWTWEGIQDHERADPVPLDKPGSEPAGNISVGSNQEVSVWIRGRSRASNDVSDRVEGLHTGHPDEPGPNGENWNSIGHHSFYVVFQRRKKTAGGPPITPPVVEPVPEPPEEPTPNPVDWRAKLGIGQLWLLEQHLRLRNTPEAELIVELVRLLDE